MEATKRKWFARKEAAAMLGVHPQTISNYAERGIIHERKVKAHSFYPVEEVEALATCDGLKASEQLAEEVARMQEEIKEKYTYTSSEYRETVRNFYAANNGREQWMRCRYIIERVLDLCAKDTLTDREKDIVSRILYCERIGDIAESYGLARERVRQIFEKALRKIAKYPGIVQEELDEAHAEVERLTTECDRLKMQVKMMKANGGREVDVELIDSTDRFRFMEPFTTLVSDLCLSVRTWNCLRAAGIETLGDLVGYRRTDLMKFRNLGRKSLSEIDTLLDKYGLTYEMWHKPQTEN